MKRWKIRVFKPREKEYAVERTEVLNSFYRKVLEYRKEVWKKGMEWLHELMDTSFVYGPPKD